MKHRSYALLLAAALSVSLLAGCGSQNNDQSSSDTSSSNQSSQSVSSNSSVSTSGSMSGSASASGSGSTSTPDASQNETQEQAKLTLSRTGFTLFSAGESYTLKTDGVPSGTKVTFQSGNPDVATVDENGKVVAVKPGTAKITVTAGDQKATCVVACKWEESKPSTGGSTSTGGSANNNSGSTNNGGSTTQKPAQTDWASVYSSAITKHGGEMVGYNPVFTTADSSMNSMILQSMGLKTSDMSAFAISASMMNTKAYAIAAVMPAEGKQSAVLQALQGYIAQKQSEFEFYLPDQKVVADAAKVGVLSNGTVLLVMNEGQDAIYSAIAGAIQAG